MTKISKCIKPTHKRKSVRDARKASKKNRTSYVREIQAALEQLGMRKRYAKRMAALLGLRPYRGKILASDAISRFVFQQQLMRHLFEHKKQNPDQRFFFVTLLSDEFRTSKVAPALWLKRLRVKSDKAMRIICKDFGAIGAIAMIEGAWVTQSLDERTGMFQFHTNGIVWADQSFDLRAAQHALDSLTNWRCVSGVRPIKMHEITPEMGSIAYWGYYMSKLPVDAVNVFEKDGGGIKVWKTQKGYRPDVRVRLFEALSQITLQDLVFSIGDGKFLRDPVMRATKEAKRIHRTDLKMHDVTRANKWFKKVWARSRANHPTGWFIAT